MVMHASAVSCIANLVSRIALVKPQKSNAVTDILIQMARSGQVRQRVTEPQLISLLDQMDQATPHETGKITVRSYVLDTYAGFAQKESGQ